MMEQIAHNQFIKKLGDICDFQGGSQPPKSAWKKVSCDGYIRMLQIRDFTQSRQVQEEFVKIDKKIRTCKETDILLGRYGASVGKVLTGLSGAYNVAIMKTIPDTDVVLPNYLKHYFLSDSFQKMLQKVCVTRSAQAGFSKEDIYDFPIYVPSLAEQERIVKKLDDIMYKIDCMKANVEFTLSATKDLFESYLETFFETSNTSWKKYKLSEISTKIGSGATPLGGRKIYIQNGVSFIRSMNVYDRLFIHDGLAHINDEQAKQLNVVTLERDDVLLNITGASVARCCVVPEDVLPARVNQHVAIIRPIQKVVDSKFLSYLLTSNYYKNKLLKDGEEGGTTRQALTKKGLEEFEVYIPDSTDEQKKMVKKLDNFQEVVNRLNSTYKVKLNLLENLRQSVLKQAFAGEL